MRVKAAGRTLTVGELREALADNDPVTLETTGEVTWAEAGAGTLEIGTGADEMESELEALWEFVGDVSDAHQPKHANVTEASKLLKEYGRA